MDWSSKASKWPKPVLFCGLNQQKYKFSMIFGTSSVGGCWGQPMLLFWKLVDETQIPQSQIYTDTFKQNLTCIFLPVRANLRYSLCHEGPCIKYDSRLNYLSAQLSFESLPILNANTTLMLSVNSKFNHSSSHSCLPFEIWLPRMGFALHPNQT